MAKPKKNVPIKDANRQPNKRLLRVTARVEGFRRAGLVHYGTKIYSLDDLDDWQINSLVNEALLDVQFIENGETVKNDTGTTAENKEPDTSTNASTDTDPADDSVNHLSVHQAEPVFNQDEQQAFKEQTVGSE